MAKRDKRSKRYLTNLTDTEWEIVGPFLPAPPKRWRKPTKDLREVLNALRYLTHLGGRSRMFPRISDVADGLLVVLALRVLTADPPGAVFSLSGQGLDQNNNTRRD